MAAQAGAGETLDWQHGPEAHRSGVYVPQIGPGGNPNEVITLVLFDSFADIAKFPEAHAKAAAEAKLQPMVNGTVTNNE